jgi:predicted transcriptional regulator of viral defense system
MVLSRLVAACKLHRVTCGVYRLPQRAISAQRSLAEVAEVATRVPRGVVCLLSALRLHGIGTQAPLEAWLAIPQTIPAPRPGSPALRVVRRSGAALSECIKRVVMDGIRVPVFNPSKTVANCFKFRHKIGLDVALELYIAIGISGAIQHGSAAAGTGGQTRRHVRVPQ